MELTKQWAAQLDDYVIDLAWAPAGDRLAAASSAGPISLFAAADGLNRQDLPGHDGGTNCLGFSPGSGMLASGGQDGAVKLWDAASGQHTVTAVLGSAWVEQLAWCPDPTAAPLVAAASGRKLVLLNADASIRHTCPDAPKTISALTWRPAQAGGASPLVAAASFGAVRLWDAGTLALKHDFPYANGIHALAWSADGKWLVSGNQDPSVHLWCLADATELQMSGFDGKVRYLSFDHTSRWLATSGGTDVSVWDCAGAGPENREPAMLPHSAAVGALRFQNTHGLLATASQDGAVMLWSPERQQPLRATVKVPSPATKLVWSPDDRQLAIGSEAGVVYVLRV